MRNKCSSQLFRGFFRIPGAGYGIVENENIPGGWYFDQHFAGRMMIIAS